jgi:hypothetical protein
MKNVQKLRIENMMHLTNTAQAEEAAGDGRSRLVIIACRAQMDHILDLERCGLRDLT